MSEYQVIARKFRPQTFKDVIGQDAVVTTLKNAIKFNRLAQAYLFCGSRGTGKTSLARLLAKALNCQQPTESLEPCNQCASCREITAGTSLDVIEIDGASHRGIEDIRQINETVGYAAASGHYKIFIIDEVHMLTKEAFNALLKTLEEPPPKVKFFFATTEVHKVLPTILSRCQRFNLNRISLPLITAKLLHIAQQLGVEVEEDALRLLAQRAEGGLRDAESLFDQILAFEEGRITINSVTSILGLMPRDIYFEIDRAGKAGDFVKAFEIAHRLFSEGKDLAYFVEGLIDHLRQILLIKLSGRDFSLLTLSETEKEHYEQSAKLYSQEQCLDLIEYLLEAQNQLRLSAFGKMALETILLHVMRSHFRLPIEHLVRRLSELEGLIGDRNESAPAAAPTSQGMQPMRPVQVVQTMQPTQPAKIPAPASAPQPPMNLQAPLPRPNNAPAAANAPVAPPPKHTVQPVPTSPPSFVSIDPTPTPGDLGKKVPEAKQPQVSPAERKHPVHHYDTILHFAAVELEGKLQKN